MENDEINLNTESNDIAGNRIDGPIGNTAAKPTPPNTGTGIPGGAPTSPDTSSPGAPASSESLADSETSVGKGAVEGDSQPQENKEANPDDLKPTDTYGGNFSNSTQGSYRDEDRRENQDSDPNRGEFGAQNLSGTTHGGFGNQNRVVDYEPNNTAEDQYYGGAGAPGVQDNAYRSYDGRDERPDTRSEYGFESGQPAAKPQASAVLPNDNGSPKGTDSGFANSYGHTSLRALQGASAPAKTSSAPNPERRNQTEDYMPGPGAPDNEARQAPNAGNAPADPEISGQRPADSQGYSDRGREEPRRSPDFQTGNDRNGYVQANNGDSSKGIGSRGGSYNDAYDDSKPGSNTGSPAKGDERTEDRSQNYGQAARAENRSGDDNDDDHGAPRRNAGRDGEADE